MLTFDPRDAVVAFRGNDYRRAILYATISTEVAFGTVIDETYDRVLGSEHIVRVVDYGQTSDGSLFYVMPYYSSTLRDLIKERLPQKELLPLYGQILDSLVEMMLQQRPEQRLQSVTRVKEELIGRGNEFIHSQRLEALRKQVVPDSQVNDPIMSDPIRAVEKEDYRNGVLTLRLNRRVNDKWDQCFRMRASAFSANVSSAMMSFRGDRVFIQVNDHFVPQAVDFFKQYFAAANEEYASQVKREHYQEIEQRRAALRSQVLAEEARSKILDKIQL
jgi:hypothetical protein